MKTRVIIPLAMLALAAPALGQVRPTRDFGPRYIVVNQTGEQLQCRYRVNAGDNTNWQTYGTVAAGGEFTLHAKVPGETVTVNCLAESGAGGGKNYTVRPGSSYRAYRNDEGKVRVGPLPRTAN